MDKFKINLMNKKTQNTIKNIYLVFSFLKKLLKKLEKIWKWHMFEFFIIQTLR
jgi:hypothetical protein